MFQEVPDFTSQFTSINFSESKPLNGLRVGLIRETLDDGVDSGVKSVIQNAATHLEELGCVVTEVFLNFCYHTVQIYMNINFKFSLKFYYNIMTGFIAILLSWVTSLLHSCFIRIIFQFVTL